MTSDFPPQDKRNPAGYEYGPGSGDDMPHVDETRQRWDESAALPPGSLRTRAQPSRRPTQAEQGPVTRKRYSSKRAVATPPPQMPAQQQQQHGGVARQRVQQHRQPIPPSQSGLYLPWWSLVLMVAIVGVVAFGVLIAFTELSDPVTPSDQLPRIQVVTSPPTLSQDFGAGQDQAAAPAGGAWPTAIPQAQPSATVPLPTPVSTQTLPPGDFAIGSQVQVVGVGGTKLNIRSEPGLESTLLFLAEEGEVYQIVGGPQNVDDYEWWKLEDPQNPDRVGWAARNFLTILSQ